MGGFQFGGRDRADLAVEASVVNQSTYFSVTSSSSSQPRQEPCGRESSVVKQPVEALAIALS